VQAHQFFGFGQRLGASFAWDFGVSHASLGSVFFDYAWQYWSSTSFAVPR
jgi:hypothetical protein